jgi:hypothetical protein
VFAQRQATSLRQMLFSIYTNKYMSQDLTPLADHMFSSGITQIAYMTRWRKQSIFWAVTQQGTLCGMTYELDQEVFAWHRHTTGDGQVDVNGNPIPGDNGFESIAVITGPPTQGLVGPQDDQLWAVVNRNIGGVPTRFIERMNPLNWEEAFAGAPATPAPNLLLPFYVDCGKSVVLPGTTTLTGFSYMEGRNVVGLVDGVPFGPVTVTGGAVQLPPQFSSAIGVAQVGLPISYIAQPMRIDLDPRAGVTQGLIKQVSDVYLRVTNSSGGSISNGVAQYQPVPIPYGELLANPFAVGPPPFVTAPTDLKITPHLNPWPDHDPTIILQGNDALPITVLALVYKYDIVSSP